MADPPAQPAEPAAAPLDLPQARRRLVLDGLGIVVSAVGFGFVYGLAARTDAGFSPIDVMAMSVFAFAGAAQFAAVGYVAAGVPWIVIGLLTGLLNARHVLYSAALAPWFRGRSFGERAIASMSSLTRRLRCRSRISDGSAGSTRSATGSRRSE